MKMPGAKNVSSTVILLVLIVAEIVSAFESVMMYTALTTLNRIYQDPVGVGWVITAFLLVGAASAAVGGRLGDIYGRGRILVVMLIASTIGSLISAWGPNLACVIFGRAIQGLAGAIFPLVIGLAREHLPRDKVALGIGYLATTAALSAALGLVVGGVIIDNLSLPWIFYCSAAMSILALLLTLTCLPCPPGKNANQGLDLLGGILFLPALTLMLIGITKAKEWGWSDRNTLLSLISGFGLLVFWARYEWRHPNPLIDVRQMANRGLGLTNLAAFVYSMALSQYTMLVLLMIQQPVWTGIGLGVTATAAGLFKLPSNMVSAISGPLSGYLAGRFGGRIAMCCGTAISLLGWVLLLVQHESFWLIMAITVVLGLGGGMMFAAIPNLVVEFSPPERTSEAIGVTVIARYVAHAVGAQLVIVLLATQTISDAMHGPGIYPAASAYQLTLLTLAGFTALGLIIAMCLPVKTPQPALAERPH